VSEFATPSHTPLTLLTPQIADLAKENLGDISLSPDEANIFVWKAILPGPAGSPYEGGMFEVDIRIPPDYPYVPSLPLPDYTDGRFSPPKLLFLTKVYHCNVAHTGAICKYPQASCQLA
jgi:ubiquitin-conjugating enzyme E2 D/E